MIVSNTEAALRSAVHQMRSLLADHEAIELDIAPVGNTRRTVQNERMWAMLHDVSRQVTWYGSKLTAEEWKDVFTAALKKSKVVPGIDGGFVVLGQRTSRMTIKQMSELITLMFAFGAEQRVVWTDPKYREYLEKAA